ncbi:MAG: serine hydrolase [Anaerolineae bacterium]|nr:serine hydrolase [Anaerolineae bacterium]
MLSIPRLIRTLLLAGSLYVLAALPAGAQSSVMAQTTQFANLRAGIGTDTDVVGEIQAGTSYPVIGRTADYPWLLLADPATGQPLGWVFRDVVELTGDPAQVPTFVLDSTWQPLANGVYVPRAFISELVVVETTPTAATAADASGATAAPEQPIQATPTLAPTLTPTLNARVTGITQGEINVRYGPGVEYPRVGVAQEGEAFEVTAWHTQLPWVQIAYAGSPNGLGWIQADLLEYSGDRFSLPAISQTLFTLPTLTPTPAVVEAVQPLGGESVPLSPEFAALGNQLWDLMLSEGFDPATSRLGTLFVMNLQTGEAFSFGGDFAFSGMSINKIAVLTEFYGQIDTPPSDAEAYAIVESMTCSENTSTNDILSIIGDGSPYAGAREVTQRLRGLGLENTFIAAPYTPDARIEPEPVTLPTSNIDQTRTEPDPSNQLEVDEVGALLNDLYQCGINERGALLDTYPDDYAPAECRQILNTMSNNRINALIEMGVPEGTRVAHKHGWIDDTHGDAGIVFTPGGDFVIVVAVHNPIWMNFEESFPLVAEITREVYNYFNPDAPMEAIREGEVSDVCIGLGNPLIEQLLAGDVPLSAGG